MLHCELVYGTSFRISCLFTKCSRSLSSTHTHTHSLTMCKYAIYAILFLNLALPVRIANLKLVTLMWRHKEVLLKWASMLLMFRSCFVCVCVFFSFLFISFYFFSLSQSRSPYNVIFLQIPGAITVGNGNDEVNSAFWKNPETGMTWMRHTMSFSFYISYYDHKKKSIVSIISRLDYIQPMKTKINFSITITTTERWKL